MALSMGVKFSCISIPTHPLNAILGFTSVFVLIIAVFTSSWIVYSSTTHYLVNRYYAARTLHLHKLSNIALITPKWNSLGAMHPFSEETDPNKPFTTPAYFVDPGYTPKKYIDRDDVCTEKMYRDHDNKTQNHYTGSMLLPTALPGAVRCILEDPYGHVVYMNGPSLSILSHISPAVYLSTLLVVYQLSLIYFIFGIFYDPSADNKYSKLVQYKHWCGYVALILYGFVLLASVLGPSTKTSKWGPKIVVTAAQTVEYSINSNISSHLYCIIVLVIYYIRASRSYPYWEYLFRGKRQYASVPSAVPGVRGQPVIPGSDQTPFLEDTSDEKSVNGHDADEYPSYNSQYPRVPVYDQHTAARDRFNPVMTHSMQMHALQMPGQAPWNHRTQDLLIDQAGKVTVSWHRGQIAGSKQHGPVSNETSMIVSLTVFLGGIANLGTARGVLLETEAQFVIICVFAFVVLESTRTHLFSYFWYLSKHVFAAAPNSKLMNLFQDEMMQVIFIFVDVVVFLMQLFIVIMWQTTMESLLWRGHDTLRGLLLAVVAVFLLVRFVSVVEGAIQLITLLKSAMASPAPAAVASDASSAASPAPETPAFFGPANVRIALTIVWQFEKVLYLLTLWLIIFGVFGLSVNGKWSAEDNLRSREKILYASAANVTKNDLCLAGVQSTTLMIESLKPKCGRDQDSQPDPVDIKVFSWTRYWRLHDSLVIDKKGDECLSRKCQGASSLFCSNGFEQHWGHCKTENYDKPGFQPRAAWRQLVLVSQRAYFNGTTLKEL